ncbi:30S ribosomal protein S7 [Candidatus Pacearchaeota archaeon]|nr:30S ribosomal protein S7 [Candidatus Pacearchaeota archaeon]
MTTATPQEHEFKAFDKYSLVEVQIKDPALKPYFNLTPRLLLKTHGRAQERFAKTKMNIIERLANRLAVPGHVGKKHKIITSWSSGKYNKNMATVLKALEMIEQKMKRNPIQVFIDAIEHASPRDEITVIEHAGARYPQAVDTSPVRRIDMALRWMVIGAYAKSFGKKKHMAETLANEIMLAAQGNMESYAMNKKNEAEKQADSAR